MNTTVRAVDHLQAALAEPHARALEALGEGSPGGPVAAVGWCSAHLAAVDRVLYPAVLRHLPKRRRAVRAARAQDRRLQQAVFRLDRRLTGDATLDHIPLADLRDEVRAALQAHAEVEAGLVDDLCAVLPPPERRALTQRLSVVMGTSPTRPHPHVRHTPLSPLVGWCDALVDRARDAMDNRADPLGRPPRVVAAPGRWGSYLLGIPYPQVSTARRGAEDSPEASGSRAVRSG